MKKILSIVLTTFLVVLMSSPAWAMWLTLKKGTASKIIQFPVYDSSSTVGATLTGLVYNTASLTAYYNREGAAGGATAITLVTATKGTWTSSGFVAVDATNMPGWYELHIPNAALATGTDSVAVHLKGAVNMVPVTILIQLVDNVEADIYSEVTNASYGLAKLVRSTTPANTLDVSATGEAGFDFSNIKQATGLTTLSNITIPTVTAITNAVTVGTNNDKTGYTASSVTDKTGYSLTQAFPANFSSLAITAGGAVTAGTVSDKTGYQLSATGVDDIWDELTTGHTISGSYGKLLADNIDAAISSRSTYAGGAVASVTGNVGGTINGLTTTAKTDVENAVWEATASNHNNSGTMGNKLNSAASAGDPWNTALPGAYGSGTAGYILGNNLNASVSSRSTLTAANVWQTDLSGYSTANQAGTLLKGAGSAGDPWSTAIPGAYGAGTAGYIIGNNLNATVSSRSSHSAADVWAVTTRLLTAGTNISLAKGTGITGFNDLSAAQVNSEVDTALSDIKLDKLLNAASTLSSDVVLGSVIGQLLDNGTSWSFDRTTDSLEALRDRGDSAWITSTLAASDVWAYSTRVLTANTNLNDPSAAVIADAVWDEARSGHTTAGSFGQGVASVQGNVTGSVGSVTSGVTVTTNNDKTGYSLTQSFPTNFSTLSIDSNGRVDLSKWIGVTPNSLISGRVDANAQVVGDKAGYSLTQSFPANFSAFAITAGGAVTVGTNNDKTGYALTSAEEDAIVDKVWNETQSGHTSAGTFGKYLDAQVSGSTAPSAATVASAVWEETSNHTTASTMGKKLNDAALAGNPWDASGICSGLTAGQCLSFIKDSTDGDKEGLDYTGIEKTIRAQR